MPRELSEREIDDIRSAARVVDRFFARMDEDHDRVTTLWDERNQMKGAIQAQTAATQRATRWIQVTAASVPVVLAILEFLRIKGVIA